MPKLHVRSQLTLGEKYKIVCELERGVNRKEIAASHGVSFPTISRVHAAREGIKDKVNGGEKSLTAKNSRTQQKLAVGERLHRWFCKADARQLPINGHMLAAQAQRICAEMGVAEVSMGWLDRWKKNHSVKFRVQHGEAGSTNEECRRFRTFSRVLSEEDIKTEKLCNTYGSL